MKIPVPFRTATRELEVGLPPPPGGPRPWRPTALEPPGAAQPLEVRLPDGGSALLGRGVNLWLPADATPRERRQLVEELGVERVTPLIRRKGLFHGSLAGDSLEQAYEHLANGLRRHPGVAAEADLAIEARYTLRASPPGGTPYAVDWHIAETGIEDLWHEGLRGRGSTVAVLDASFRLTHKCLAKRYSPASRAIGPGVGKPIEARLPTDGQLYGEALVHGTGCAGIVAGGPADDGTRIGVAPEAELLLVKLVPTPSRDGRLRFGPSTFTAAIEYAARHADVVTCSVGLRKAVGLMLRGSISDALESAVGGADRSVPVFWAVPESGDVGEDLLSGHYETIAVGACDTSRAPYRSAGGRELEFLAPGVEIPFLEVESDSSWGLREGTSCAAPWLAGLAALLVGRFQDIHRADLVGILRRSASADSPANETGYGVPRPRSALDLLGGGR